jgi:hypothetical protein
MAHAGDQAGPLEQPHGPGLIGVDHHGIIGLWRCSQSAQSMVNASVVGGRWAGPLPGSGTDTAGGMTVTDTAQPPAVGDTDGLRVTAHYAPRV